MTPPPPPPPQRAAARRLSKASSLLALASPEGAAAGGALDLAKKGGAAVKEFLDYDNFEWRETKTVGRGAKARQVTRTFRVSRGDWLAVGLLGLTAEGLLMFSHALAGLNPLAPFEEIAAAVASEVTAPVQALGTGIHATVTTMPGSTAPPAAQPTSLAAAISYHALRGNAHYTNLRARLKSPLQVAP